MRVILTGASGFLGRNFLELAPKSVDIVGVYNRSKDLERFVQKKRLGNVKLYKCDLTKENEVQCLFEKIGKDMECCIYLAANVDVPLSIADPLLDLQKTVGGLINFLQSCRHVKKFIYMSSAGVYDGLKGEVTTEAILNPIIPYCISKMTAEQYIKFYASIGKIDQYTILRFGGAFGKYSRTSKFITKMVEDIYIKNKKMIEAYGDGTNIINVMYVKEVVRALLFCLGSKRKSIVCNLGQENMTINETIQRIARVFNRTIKIVHTPRIQQQKYIHFNMQVDFDKFFRFKPEYSFESGIKELGKILQKNASASIKNNDN